jgi:hypothetical protein
VSRRAVPGGGPRSAPGPRSGSGRRGPGTPRRARQPVRAAHAAIEARAVEERLPAPAVEVEVEPAVAPEIANAAQPEPAADPQARGPAGELGGLRALLDQLDALLRDPTLTRALRAFAARVSDGLRAAGAAAADATRRMLHALGKLRLPRRLLLGLLALLLPLALLALLLGGGGDDRAASTAADRPAQSAGSLAGVGMPGLASGPEDPKPLHVALVVDSSYDTAALRRELTALGSWIAANHAAGTRVSVIDAASGSATAPLRPSALATAVPTRPQASTTAAIRSALGSDGRRLLVTIGSSARAPARASTLNVATRRGATATEHIALKRGGHTRVAIDERRPDALAASVARAMMALSGQRERR